MKLKPLALLAATAAMATLALTACGSTTPDDGDPTTYQGEESSSAPGANGSSVKEYQIGDSGSYEEHYTLTNGTQVVCIYLSHGFSCDWPHASLPGNLEGKDK